MGVGSPALKERQREGEPLKEAGKECWEENSQEIGVTAVKGFSEAGERPGGWQVGEQLAKFPRVLPTARVSASNRKPRLHEQ